jgi:uncharacterized FlaG/YvyC family protein
MDMKAVKAVAGVAATPVDQGRASGSRGEGREPPRGPAHLDPEAVQNQRQRQAAVARRMNDFLRSNARELEFHFDAASGNPVITVRDAAGNIVRTIPGEEAMQMLRRLTVESGTFLDMTV